MRRWMIGQSTENKRASAQRQKGHRYHFMCIPCSLLEHKQHHKRKGGNIKVRGLGCDEIQHYDMFIALMHSHQLWLPAEDKHKIKAASIPAQMEKIRFRPTPHKRPSLFWLKKKSFFFEGVTMVFFYAPVDVLIPVRTSSTNWN